MPDINHADRQMDGHTRSTRYAFILCSSCRELIKYIMNQLDLSGRFTWHSSLPLTTCLLNFMEEHTIYLPVNKKYVRVLAKQNILFTFPSKIILWELQLNPAAAGLITLPERGVEIIAYTLGQKHKLSVTLLLIWEHQNKQQSGSL